MSDPQAPTAEHYWHLWTDADGISRQERCTISQFLLVVWENAIHLSFREI